MTPGQVLLELRRLGFAVTPSGDRVRLHGPGGVLTQQMRDDLVRQREVLRGMVAGMVEPKPNLVDLNREWRARTGGSVRDFLAELQRVTGCDFDERNPEWIELYTFAAHVEALGSDVREESA